ncbi:kinetochore-associated protein NSL1 homolog isoform X1 [Synchiropus splendidus]|uniref:kinetochore-associated protein NSL1 homolog isoform X1 n=1 Tax=Synchiropus splendidus TaxID=270530 RepID=UPI00237D4520|nr:kinetochore-associated protein NSL1 homolog isoform X1 [Synchiropus splendidus]
MDRDPTEHISDELTRDHGVWVRSKRTVLEHMNKYKAILATILDDQPEVEAETRRVLLQELLANFEEAVLENVLVNGLKWTEAPDAEEEEVLDLEDQLSDTILEATLRRRTFPRQILAHVVGALKAERLLMGGHDPMHTPSLLPEPGQEKLMQDLSVAAPDLVQHTLQVVKSIQTLQHQALGLRHILQLDPSSDALQIHHDVLGRAESPPPCRTGSRPIRRAVEEAAMADCYVVARSDDANK